MANRTQRGFTSPKREGRRGLLSDPRKKELIPDKLYFRIGEVARLTGIQPYILRYWESEFPLLQPKKSGTGQRLYRKRDIEIILKIKQLLYDLRYTIAGARRRLQEEVEPVDLLQKVQRIREGLEGLLAILGRS